MLHTPGVVLAPWHLCPPSCSSDRPHLASAQFLEARIFWGQRSVVIFFKIIWLTLKVPLLQYHYQSLYKYLPLCFLWVPGDSGGPTCMVSFVLLSRDLEASDEGQGVVRYRSNTKESSCMNVRMHIHKNFGTIRLIWAKHELHKWSMNGYLQ